jgi:hypothetical protein
MVILVGVGAIHARVFTKGKEARGKRRWRER